MAKFAVFMREDDDAWSKLPDAEQERLLKLYSAYFGELKGKGALVEGNPLGGPARLLRVVGGKVVDGPMDDAKQTLTGYFIVEAPDMAAATALARGCPALVHGETLEVRPVGHA